MNLIRLMIFAAVLTCLAVIVAAQTDTACPTIVSDALNYVDTLCNGAARNQACYGNLSLIAQPQPDVTDLKFDAPGDIANIIDIQSLHLSPMRAPDEWGVALMKLQANLPGTMPGQNVTVLLFGDVEIESAYTPVLKQVTVTGGNINVRGGPSTSDAVVGSLAGGTTVKASGRTQAGDWIRVRMPDGGTGWVADFLVTSDEDLSELDVVSIDTPTNGPMQSFYFRSGIGDSACDEAPNSGILIQTAGIESEIYFTINEVSITLGSTVFMEAAPDDYLYINLLKGKGLIKAEGVEQPLFVGSRVRIPMDKDMKASGPPDKTEPYDLDHLQSLPLDLLPFDTTIIDPLSQEDIEKQIAGQEPCRIQSNRKPNVRTGPGTNYPILTQMGPSVLNTNGVAIDGQGYTWYRVRSDYWVREDVVTTSGECAELPVVTEISPAPTPKPVVATGGGASGTTAQQPLYDYVIQWCAMNGGSLQVGIPINLTIGVGSWSSREAGEAALAGVTPVITVDGVALNAVPSGMHQCCPIGDPNQPWVSSANATWTPTSGTHTIYGGWPGVSASLTQNTCTVTLP